jgi:hypothetical protein
MSKSRKSMPGLLQPDPLTSPHVGKRKSFEEVEAKAREVLRQRGLTEAQITRELQRAKRESD